MIFIIIKIKPHAQPQPAARSSTPHTHTHTHTHTEPARSYHSTYIIHSILLYVCGMVYYSIYRAAIKYKCVGVEKFKKINRIDREKKTSRPIIEKQD